MREYMIVHMSTDEVHSRSRAGPCPAPSSAHAHGDARARAHAALALDLRASAAPTSCLLCMAIGSMIAPLTTVLEGATRAACEAAVFHSRPIGARSERSN